jgi:hypothetical protein
MLMQAQKTKIGLARWLALGAIAGPVLFTIAWIILGFVNTGYTLWGVHVAHYSPVQQQISALGVGNTAPFMNATFIIAGSLLIVGTIGIFRVFRHDLSAREYRWCLALCLLPGIGSIVDGIFTFEHFFGHFIGFGLALMSIFAFTCTGLLLRHATDARPLAYGLLAAGPLTVVLTVLFFATFTPTAAGQLTGIAGLTERLLVTEILGWYAVMGWVALRSKVVE